MFGHVAVYYYLSAMFQT